MSTMTLDEARAVLAQIGATEESTAVDVQALVKGIVRQWALNSIDAPEDAEPGPMPTTLEDALTALDTLRSAREEKLLGLVRTLLFTVERQDEEFREGTCHLPYPCEDCTWNGPDGCDYNIDALLLEARQALGEGEK